MVKVCIEGLIVNDSFHLMFPDGVQGSIAH